MTTRTSHKIEGLADIQLSFGKALWAIRTSDELTQEVFAKKLSVSKQYLSTLENDKKSVSIEQAKRFAKILGQSEKVFIKYVLQDLLNKNHAHYQIDLHSLAKTKGQQGSQSRT